ncbi:MAG: Glyoxalase ElbB [Chlamydiia bacterium]|nr:Glyoxalase ElbB [Chlamydiia bacterium]
MSKKIAIILSGCGGLDGAEVSEGVCSLLAIENAGFSWEAFSLNENQKNVISHSNMKKIDQTRNMMAEAGRIVHGKINELKDLKISHFDVLWFVGGYGVVSSFSDLAEKGVEGTVHPEIRQVILDFYQAKKPMVGICIAPSIIAKTLSDHKLTITLGKSDEYTNLLKNLGHDARKIESDEFVYDEDYKIYSTPAFMNEDATVLMIYEALQKITKKLASEKCHL